MTVDDVHRVRSIGLIGQGDVGKTTLGEAMLFVSGALPRMGRVEEGTTALDVEPEEIKRQISLTPGFHHLAWKKCEVSVVDTPGYANFLPETRACLRGLTGAVLVLSPTGDLKVEAERVWGWAEEEGVPLLAFVNRMDRERADFSNAVHDLTERLGGKAAVLHHPIGREADFRGVVDLLAMKAWVTEGEGRPQATEVPAAVRGEVDAARSRLVEAIAESNDELLERYLEDGDLSMEDLQRGLLAGVRARSLVPVLCGAAPRLIGVEPLLDAIVDCLPSPADLPPATGDDPASGDTVEREGSVGAPFSAFVFKTIIDPFVGKLSVFRTLSGKVSSDATVYNASRDVRERLGAIYRLEGKKQAPVGHLLAGEIGAVAKLKETMTGDTLCDEKAPIRYPGLPDFAPVISFAIEPKTRADEDKAVASLRRLAEEDPALVVGRDEQTREILLSGAGQNHVETVVERLKRKYGVEVLLKAPKVPYKETIRATARAQGKYKKQTGGRGQYGDTWIQVEPLQRGAGFDFVNQIVGGVIPRQYVPAVEKGVREALVGGIVAGYPMVDVKVTLYDGSYHEVDSSEMAFKIAGSLGVKNAVQQAKPTLLEPIMNIEVTVPSECVGDVIGDLNSRRGRVSGVEGRGAHEVVRGVVPMAEVLSYAPDLRSMTSGRGGFRLEFAHYEEVPAHLIDKIVKEAQAARSETKESR
jgi:elongation factor G